jgi:hypothetical protein
MKLKKKKLMPSISNIDGANTPISKMNESVIVSVING